VVHWIAPTLNKASFMDFPLGFYMAAQGSLVVFVVQLFLFAKQQEKIDRECGMAEEE
jgi:putative solute:sodium symporter small subunit